QIVGRLTRSGVGAIFITHRMDEISEIGDRITVMRSGDTVATLERGKWTPRELVRLMTGSDQLTEHARQEVRAAVVRRGELALSVRDLRLRASSRPIDADIFAGELVGVAGLEGHGQDEFLDALRGAGAVDGEVVRRVEGEDAQIRSPIQAARLGVAYVPRERRQTLFGWMSIRENFGMPTLSADTRRGWLRLRLTRRRLADYVKRL